MDTRNTEDRNLPGQEDVGIVVIGRNEGERLRVCIESLLPMGAPIVYVDSGSSDNSRDLAREAGCSVVELNLNQPFTAARARNAGFRQLILQHADVRYVQFLDGDCELQKEWLGLAKKRLESTIDVGIVCGRRRERNPDASIYNHLCDLEWDTPVGMTEACGGDFLVRADAFRDVGGFNPTLIAGEEPEMCFRMRQQGWRVERLGAEMTLHDAAISRFSQFWQRARRSGHAYAQGALMHRFAPQRYQQREVASILFWTVTLPISVLILLLTFPIWSAVILLAYPILWLRIVLNRLRLRNSIRSATAYATFILCGKFAQLTGLIEFLRKKITRSQFEIIEYK